MILVRDGHLSELTVLFDRYHVKLYNFFFRLTFDKALSEDLTQNLFYRLIRYRNSYQENNGSFRSWFYRMARNVHIDHCRQLEKRPEVAMEMDNAGESMLPQGNDYTEEQFDQLDLALKKLPPDQREVLILSRYQGLKYEEIARIRDSTVTAIKVQAHRAIKQLRKLYYQQSLLSDPNES